LNELSQFIINAPIGIHMGGVFPFFLYCSTPQGGQNCVTEVWTRSRLDIDRQRINYLPNLPLSAPVSTILPHPVKACAEAWSIIITFALNSSLAHGARFISISIGPIGPMNHILCRLFGPQSMLWDIYRPRQFVEVVYLPITAQATRIERCADLVAAGWVV
jgi:hypothetical protein